VQSLRKHTYGRIHRILAGCYFQEGEPRKFFRHMLKSVRYDARNATYFAAYPLRVARRTFGGGQPAITSSSSTISRSE
jgi:hypothetical protein